MKIPINKNKIVCPDGTAEIRALMKPESEEQLKSLGEFVWYDDNPETSEDYLQRVHDADGIILNWDLPSQLLESCKKLKIISFMGADPRKFVDLPKATGMGIAVSNTPSYADEEVATHAMALILSCAKRIVRFSNEMHQGIYEQGCFTAGFRGKILGLVGLGGIGAEVARLAQAFGMNVLCWTQNPTQERACQHGVEFVALAELFRQADIVSLHVPQKPETEMMITRDLLQSMKQSAIFINTARAELVDNSALAELLKDGKLSAAGLDVHDQEPISPDDPFLGIENAVLTPHVGANTARAQGNIMKIAVDNLAAFFSGRPENVLNFEALF
jgi:phosphoglycerate dehydrogenase-like enzyme